MEIGTAGASLQRTYERRSAARSNRIRARFPRLGGLILAVSPDPQTTLSFKVGAEGERRAAAKIMERAGPEVAFLLNRRLGPRRRDGDIDLLAINPAGIYVVDVKRYQGAKVRVHRTARWRQPAREQLIINGRDKTRLLESLHRQVAAVKSALASAEAGADVPVTSAFCFVDADLPLFSTPKITGTPIVSPKQAARLVATPGEISAVRRDALHAHLARSLPAAR